MKYVILLTACINPGGMAFTKLSDPDERKTQYIDAINYYVKKTTFPIVFVENSNTDISFLFQDKIIEDRLEFLTFKGNADKTRGKGYGEAEIIEYAMNHSKNIAIDSNIIKITGRLIVENVMKLVASRDLFCLKYSIQCAVNSEFSFADSRILISSVIFMRQFLNKKYQIDDSKNVFFEHVLLNTIKEIDKFYYFPFLEKPQIIGVSGSTGEVYLETCNSFNMRISYLNYQLWIVTSYPNYSLKRMPMIKSLLIRIVYFFFKLHCKVYRC